MLRVDGLTKLYGAGGAAAGGVRGIGFHVAPGEFFTILGPSGWLQGKLRFTQSGVGHTRKIYGPGDWMAAGLII